MVRHLLTVFAYIISTFIVQATSHFVVFAEHYEKVPHIKQEPIFALGISSMVIQGLLISIIYSQSKNYARSRMDALQYSWTFGLFLVSYIALAEAAKYTVPDMGSWIGVEILVGFLQFTLFGIVMSYIHKER